jgi:hypothetical protein
MDSSKIWGVYGSLSKLLDPGYSISLHDCRAIGPVSDHERFDWTGWTAYDDSGRSSHNDIHM